MIANLNITSLPKHIDELRVFISTSKIHILSINETRLDSTISDNEVYLPGCELIRLDRNRNGGGVCCYVRSNLNYRIRNDLMNDNLEFLTIEISKPRSKPLIISTRYKPPDSPVSVYDDFEELVAKIDSLNLEYHLSGDINTDLLPGVTCPQNTLKASKLKNIYGLSQLITEPTRITLNSETLIDLCITNCPEKITTSGVIHLGISDHPIVYMMRKTRCDRSGPQTIEFRNFKDFNKESFLNDLELIPREHIFKINDPNEMWELWKNQFVQCADKHAPLKKRELEQNGPRGSTTN